MSTIIVSKSLGDIEHTTLLIYAIESILIYWSIGKPINTHMNCT